MLKIGITGSFGAGKSTVAAMFVSCAERRGLRVTLVDADAMAHELLKHDAVCIRAVRRAFGPDVKGPEGIDRAALGRIVFRDPARLKALEAIVHPRLWRRMQQCIVAARGVVILDAALLIEAGWQKCTDAVILVKARRDIQLRRAMARTGLSRTEVLERLRCQMPFAAKMKFASHVIDNSGTSAATRKHVERIFRSLLKPTHEERPS